MTSTLFGPDWSASRAHGSRAERQGWLDAALDAVDSADLVARRWFRRELEITRKPDRTYVTAADQEIERLLRQRIGDQFPGHGLVGEEYGTEQGDAEARWYIDPIDATANFVRGVPIFAVLLALEVAGEIQVGVISAPALRERWYAARGLGAWASGGATDATSPRRLHVSRVSDVADAHILYGSAVDVASSGKAPGFLGLLGDAWRDRGFGDFWGYALLAEGAGDAMVEADLSPWDLAAPAVIVEEAGGRFSDLTGVRRIDGRSALATNGLLHDELLERLACRS
jgi:histidinol-phosphatase